MPTKPITKKELIESIYRLNKIKLSSDGFNYEIVNSIAILHFGNELNYSGDFKQLIVDIKRCKEMN